MGLITVVSIFLFALTTQTNVRASDLYITSAAGAPTADYSGTITVGPRGPILLADTQYVDNTAHFNRQIIPERATHAKGTGALGSFTVTHAVSQYSSAAVFSEVGKVTKVAVRFSTMTLERGSSDTVRDMRGFAIKFYTEDGNFDIVGSNIPVFYFRDPLYLISLMNSLRRNPSSNLIDQTMAWDFATLRPETVHANMYLYSDLGTPDGFRHMDGFGVHAFSLLNNNSGLVYCKFKFSTNQGIRNLTAEEAVRLRGSNPDYAVQDLYDAIESGNYPSWTLYIQVMDKNQAANASFNPFDPTKIWPDDEYPLIEVGQLVLDINPINHFEQIEQIAFTPANLVRGTGIAPDKLLHGRLFTYGDAQRYRIGSNFMQLPINCPFLVHNFQRNGAMAYFNQGNETNYYPSTYGKLKTAGSSSRPSYQLQGEVMRHDMKDDDNFSQSTVFYESLDQSQRTNLIVNLAKTVRQAKNEIQVKTLAMFSQVSKDLGNNLQKELGL